jgi:hypothetical protein
MPYSAFIAGRVSVSFVSTRLGPASGWIERCLFVLSSPGELSVSLVFLGLVPHQA